MYSVQKTEEFDKWLRKLKDQRAKAKVLFRFKEYKNMGTLEIVNL